MQKRIDFAVRRESKQNRGLKAFVGFNFIYAEIAKFRSDKKRSFKLLSFWMTQVWPQPGIPDTKRFRNDWRLWHSPKQFFPYGP